MAKLESGVGCHTFHTEHHTVHHTGINVVYLYFNFQIQTGTGNVNNRAWIIWKKQLFQSKQYTFRSKHIKWQDL